jgi:DNA-binding CsgD family transcriptional regulator
MRDHASERPTRDETSDRDCGVEAPVRRLLRDLAAIGFTSAVDADDAIEQALLDVEVDGVRCLLIRRPPHPERSGLQVLSPREHEIARMVAKGYANKTIASVLDISSWTVSSHLRRIYTKLGVGSRAAMVACLLGHAQDGERPPMPALSPRPRPGHEREGRPAAPARRDAQQARLSLESPRVRRSAEQGERLLEAGREQAGVAVVPPQVLAAAQDGEGVRPGAERDHAGAGELAVEGTQVSSHALAGLRL